VKYASELERQLESLGEKHRDLLESYNQQFDEAARLKNQITDLTAQILYKKKGEKVVPVNIRKTDGSMPGGETFWKFNPSEGPLRWRSI
jgi:hypothetical protein